MLSVGQGEAVVKLAAAELHRRTGNIYEELPLESWLVALHVLEDGKPYSFEGYEAFLGIMADTHLRKVVMKAAQIGATTAFIGAALWSADHGKATIYYLPDETLIPDIHKTRVKPVFDFVPYLRNRVSNRDAVGTIPIGKSTVYFIGLKGALAVESRPAQRLIFDEVDKAARDRVIIAKERLGATPPAEQSIYYLSKPSIPGYGISALYEDSDKRQYTARCGCGEWTPLEWMGGVVEKVGDNAYELRDRDWTEGSALDIRVHCLHCGRPVNRADACEWVPMFPGRDYHGYKLSRLHFQVHTVADMWREFTASLGDEGRMTNFYNAWLGEPYAAAGTKLDVALLDAIKGDYLPESKSAFPCVLGADIGQSSGHRWGVYELASGRVLDVGVTDWPTLDGLYKKYNIVGAVIDGRPETTKAIEFQRAHRNVYLAEYAIDAGGVYVGVKEREDSMGRITWAKLERTRACDRLVAAVIGGEFRLPSNANLIGDVVPGQPYRSFYAELLSPARVVEESSKGPRYVWRESGADHYFHALVYMLAARELATRGGPPVYTAPIRDEGYI